MSISKRPPVKRLVKKATMRKHEAPKVFDVARPGKTPANSTSRPVIITNRPVMQDPMVVSAPTESEATQKAAAEQLTTTPILQVTKKLIIKPLHEHIEPETTVVTPVSASNTETNTELAAPDLIIQNLDDSEALLAANQALISDVVLPKIDAQITPGAADAAADSAKKRAIELQRIVDGEKYFLPINSLENKRNKRIAIAGLVLIIILGIAWYDTALDAGLLANMHNLPHSHFFRK